MATSNRDLRRFPILFLIVISLPYFGIVEALIFFLPEVLNGVFFMSSKSGGNIKT